MEEDIRWKQRFANFDRAVNLLQEPIDMGVSCLSDLEKEGMVQRFEYALELAWKTLKDYMEYEGQLIDPVTPRNVIKTAYAARVIPDGDIWIDMLNHRNLLSHTYDSEIFENVTTAINKQYFPVLHNLHKWFIEKGAQA